MKKMLLVCVALMMVAAMVSAQVPAAPTPAKDAPKAAMAADAVKTITGILTVDVAKKEASIKVGEITTKLEFNKVVEDSKLSGKKVEAKGTMLKDVLTATEIKEATAAPLAPKADAPKP